jgi:hypothetical protein
MNYRRTAVSTAVVSAVMVLGAVVMRAEPVSVPATANWAVHFDFQAFARTQLGAALDARPKSESEKRHLALARLVLGTDFERDLFALTLYGPDQNREKAVLVVRGKFHPDKVTGYLATRSNFSSVDFRGHQIVRWGKDGGEKLFAIPGAIAFHSSGVAVLAASVEAVEGALDLLDGQVESAPVPEPEDAANPYFLGFANLKGLGELRPEAALLRQSNRMMIAVGEKDEMVSTRLTLNADSAEGARQIEAVVQGVQAYALLRSTGDWAGLPDWLLTGTVVRDDSTLHFFLDAPTERILKVIEPHLGIK